MIGNHLTILAVGLLTIATTAGATSDEGRQALSHAADKATEMASGHSVFQRESHDASCDGFRNHGEYVSGVAQADATEDDDASDESAADEAGADRRANRTDHPNGTSNPGHNETGDAGDTADGHAEDHGSLVSEAARSDTGKCAPPEPAEQEAGGDAEEAPSEESEPDGHGRSNEARSEHPPRNK